MPGTLYVVATPIGNLEDITYRAVRILGEVNLIACEDTRQTRTLLNRFQITRPVVSYHEHNERARSEQLLAELQNGKNIALVSDAGTPLIADPGYRLVTSAIVAGIPVCPVPGPSAVLAALSASGLAADSFLFFGFLPAKSGQRRKALEHLHRLEVCLVLYEAPHRILDTLADIASVMGVRPLVLARELTKVHEEFLRGTAAELLDTLRARAAIRGELTLVVGRSQALPEEAGTIEEAVEELVRSGIPRMEALKQVARRRGLSKREVYQHTRIKGCKPGAPGDGRE